MYFWFVFYYGLAFLLFLGYFSIIFKMKTLNRYEFEISKIGTNINYISNIGCCSIINSFNTKKISYFYTPTELIGKNRSG